MSTTPLNPAKFLNRQGLDPKIVYVGLVVDNEDPRGRRRVRVRIAGIHSDEIPDNHLPWAIPTNQNYAMGGAQRSGIVDIPTVNSKIGIKFLNGDPHKPIQAPYPGDAESELPEGQTNYPYRKVLRFANGFYIIVDTLNNECLLNNPGDMHLTVLGDCTQTVVGNHTLLVSGKDSDIPNYLTNASDTKLSEIQAKSAGNVSFSGSGSRGSQYVHIRGDQTMVIDGNRNVKIKGNDTLSVGRNRHEKISGEHTIDSSRSNTN